ncbi:hypothetical protein OESDEN_16798 [Oesophagostomum dentatum]|uniref:Uncharacterized protein n=1 Tax=Oesophagostomum dentatum TaxID=61180 RepID=A0A0B1SDW1_OESDE|nr:hypothetical protein OESDEN_16798 [Oesophagostomum dentatum]
MIGSVNSGDWNPILQAEDCIGVSFRDEYESRLEFIMSPITIWLACMYHLSCFGAIAVCLAEWTLTPPVRYPHIFPLLNAVYSCSHFLLFLAYFYFEMIRDEYQLYMKKKT